MRDKLAVSAYRPYMELSAGLVPTPGVATDPEWPDPMPPLVDGARNLTRCASMNMASMIIKP